MHYIAFNKMEVSGSYKKAECAETLVITKVTHFSYAIP